MWSRTARVSESGAVVVCFYPWKVPWGSLDCSHGLTKRICAKDIVRYHLFRREENPKSGQTDRASRPVTREEWNSIDFRNPYTFLDNLETNSFIACFQDPNSTMEHPTQFVWTRSKDGQEVLRVDLDKVDPKNATRAEIYALINHLYKGEDYMCAMATFTYVENECKDLTNYGEVDFSARAISVPSSAQRLNYEKIFQDAAKRIGEFLKRQADEGLQKTYDTLLDMVDRFKGYPKDGTSTPALPKEA